MSELISATIRLTCTDLPDCLCRVIDQGRRMKMILHSIAAAASPTGGTAELVIKSATSGMLSVLVARIQQMESVLSVSIHAVEAIPPADDPERSNEAN